MSTHHDDRGVLAVRRVRSVREQDSRLGLQQAVQERREAGNRVNQLRWRLNAAEKFGSGSTAGFLLARDGLAVLTTELRAAEAAWETSRTVTEAARARWETDRSRLRAIDLLLDRRAAARADERRRRAAHDLDELAAQRWLRGRGLQGGDAA